MKTAAVTHQDFSPVTKRDDAVDQTGGVSLNRTQPPKSPPPTAIPTPPGRMTAVEISMAVAYRMLLRLAMRRLAASACHPCRARHHSQE